MPQKITKRVKKTMEAIAALKSWFDTAGVKRSLSTDERLQVESMIRFLELFALGTKWSEQRR
jgi:hypothetical protein